MENRESVLKLIDEHERRIRQLENAGTFPAGNMSFEDEVNDLFDVDVEKEPRDNLSLKTQWKK